MQNTNAIYYGEDREAWRLWMVEAVQRRLYTECQYKYTYWVTISRRSQSYRMGPGRSRVDRPSHLQESGWLRSSSHSYRPSDWSVIRWSTSYCSLQAIAKRNHRYVPFSIRTAFSSRVEDALGILRYNRFTAIALSEVHCTKENVKDSP